MLLKVFLLQLAVVALQTCPVASAGPFCPELFGGFEDLESGNAVTLSLNCSSNTLMPVITFETVDESFSNDLVFSVDYICNSSGVQPEPTGVLDHINNPGVHTVEASFSEGTDCTFYGCYRSSGVPFRSSLAIQPTPCVIDINECEQGGHNCDVNAQCDNTVGSFECRCDVGFTGNGTNCDDINECEQGGHNCDVNAQCNNTVGSFECHCNDGFTGNGTHCDDINECEHNHTCDINEQCNNTVGGFECHCNDGFMGNGTHCDDIDECDQGDHNCDINAQCDNTVGGFECHCNDGFTTNGTQCDDINECMRGNLSCDINAQCDNTVGSFDCICSDGFTGNGTHCDDINECVQGDHNCDMNAQCDNTVGSFECLCDAGFTGNGTHCDAAPGDDPSVQFVIVAVVIFVTLAATLLAITMYIRKAQKRQHTMWSEMRKYFKKNMKEMKVDLDFKPVEPHGTLPHSISFVSNFDVLVVDTEDGLVTDQEMSESILEPSANGDTGDSDINRNEDYKGMAFPKERERASEQTDYVIQPGTHNHGTGDTQDKDTGCLYSDTLSAGSSSQSSFTPDLDTLEHDIGLSECDTAVSTSEQYSRSDSYIKEHPLPNVNGAVSSDFSLDVSELWLDQSSNSFPESMGSSDYI